MCNPLMYVDDGAYERELSCDQPISLFRWTEQMGLHETFPPIHAVNRVVFRVAGVEEPQHALESPGGVR